MPTIFTHVAIPLALGCALGRRTLPPRLIAAGMLVSILPDVDAVAFKLGIAYADQFGHRGASHSLLFALAIGLAGASIAPWLKTGHLKAVWYLALCTASHPLLDALTDGGLGVALQWPWSEQRFFAPWRPIAVSPIGIGFFSARGLAVLWSELLWVWLPAAAIASAAWAVRRRIAQRVERLRF